MRQTLTSVTLATTLTLFGCAGKTIKSVELRDTGANASGIVYALPRGLVKITVSLNDKQALTFNAEPIIVADTGRRYLSQFLPSGFAEDSIEVVVDGNGLLSTTTVITEDKTPEIIKNLAELVARVSTLGTLRQTGDTLKPFSIESVIDPFDSRTRIAFNKQLEKLSGGTFEIKVSSDPASTITPASDPNVGFPVDCTRSLCFRIPTPVFVTLRSGTRQSKTDFATKQVSLPDPSFVGGVDVTRAPCIKKTTTLKFTSGMLTSHKIDKPSEVLACLSIPAAVLDALVGGAVKRFGDRKKISEAEDGYLKAQISLAATQQKILEAQMANQTIATQQQLQQPERSESQVSNTE